MVIAVENEMDTLLDYMTPKLLGRDYFIAQFRHPFLLVRGDGLERRNFGFHTDMASAQISQHRLSALHVLHERGQRLAPGTAQIGVIKVQKRADGAFRENIFIGRTAQCDISIPDRRISKMHAYIQQNGYLLYDGNSTNGTIVNGQRLARGQPHVLRKNDVIELAPFRLEFVDALLLYELLDQSLIAMDAASSCGLAGEHP